MATGWRLEPPPMRTGANTGNLRELLRIRGEAGEGYLVVRRVCEVLGLDSAGQWTKLQKARWARIENISTPDRMGHT
jgi:hypothetical protein